MAVVLAHNWGAIALRGVAAIVFGLSALFLPGVTLAALIVMFAAYALVDGVLAVIAAVRGPAAHGGPWLSLALEGIVTITAGAAALLLPAVVAAAVLVYVVAVWALLTGALRLAAATRLRRVITGEWRMALGGIASLVFGALVMLAPALAARVMVVWVGAWATIVGAALLALAIRLLALHAEHAHDGDHRLRRVA